MTPSWPVISRGLAWTALLTCSSGCATSYRFKVDAVQNESAAPLGDKQSYQIVNANPEMNDGDLQVKEVERYIQTALSSKGMYETPAGAKSDMVVEVDFGMDSRKEVQTDTTPIIASVGGGVQTMQIAMMDPMTKRTVYVTQQVEQPIRQEFVGYQEHEVTVTVYEKYLRITARETPDEANDHPPRELWSVYVTNEDENSDLRKYIPLLVSAAMDAVAENSSSQKVVVLSPYDERVIFVQKGM